MATKKTSSKKFSKSSKSEEKELARKLIKNSSDIQAKNVELITNMNKLIKKIDKFLDLFEEASKKVNEVEDTEQRIEALSNRLEILLEQNKTIAKGLILLEKYVKGKTSFESSEGPENVEEYKGI